MADIPIIRSPSQILGGMINTVTSKLGLKNLRVGSPVLSLLEAASSSDFRGSQSVIQLLNSFDLDNATGLALIRKGQAEQVFKITETLAVGTVTITDTSFVKVSTTIFQGSGSPIVGAVSINVVDASSFTNTGSLYIGRNTANYEGPIPYTGLVNNGSYWTITLSTPLTKFHNNIESVILAQGGNRAIGTDAVVQVPQANLTTAVQFNLLYPATIPDGETLVDNVSVICTLPGSVGNVAAGAISTFTSLPFPGASVTNNKPFTTGLDTESDDDYRARIKDARASRVKGTSLAITSSVIGITAPDENKKVSSAALVKQNGAPTVLYIDDGTGYEEITQGVGVEVLVASANGGEQNFETTNKPIAKAYLLNINPSPYNLVAGQELTVAVGGETSIHIFNASDFIEISNASSYEICASINGNPNLLFSARTIENGNRVIIFAKSETNEDINVIPNDNDANAILGFSSGTAFTTQLYKNDVRLIKDGKTARIFANSFGLWNAMSGNQTLIISVDNTPAQTYTFTDQDFINQNTGFNTLGKNTIEAWISVLNSKVPGITADQDNQVLFIQSNSDASNRAALNITGGSLIASRMFVVSSDFGLNSDYTLDRNNGRITLSSPLVTGDKLSIGSVSTRSFAQSNTIPLTTLGSTARAWLQVDGAATIINHGITGSTNITVTVDSVHEWGYILQISSDNSSFLNINAGDWVVIWDPSFNSTLQGAFRVTSSSNNFIKVERRLALTARNGHRSVTMAAVSTGISRVLTCGGSVKSLSSLAFGTLPSGTTSGCEIYDPNTKQAVVAQSMTTPRAYHTATLLNNGKIYVTGGLDDAGNFLTSTEIYDPGTDIWTAKQTLTSGVCHHRAVLLNDGTVLVMGGLKADATSSNLAYIYDPVGDTLNPAGSNMVVGRASFGAVLLSNNKVLVAGGRVTGNTSVVTCEIYDPGPLTFGATGSMTVARQGLSLGNIGSTNTVLAVGNSATATHGACEQYEIYTIGTATWSAPVTLPSSTAFRNCKIVTTQDGANYIFHGSFTSGSEVANNVKCSPTGTFTSLGANPDYPEAAPKYDVQAVLLNKADNSYLNHVVVLGGAQITKVAGSIDPTSSVEEFDGNSGLFSTPEPGLGTFTLTSLGVSFVRTPGRLQQISIPPGTNYTASSLAAILNTEIDGAEATVYKTNKIRINTNTHELNGSFGLSVQDSLFSNFGFDVGNDVLNQTGHIGSIESVASDISTPSFQSLQIRGSVKPTSNTSSSGLILNNPNLNPSYTLVGLKSWFTIDGASTFKRYGTDDSYRTTLVSALSFADTTKVETRVEPINVRLPYDRAYLAAPFAITPNDSLIVKVDNDDSKIFNVKMSRKLQTVGTTYSQTNAFKDADNSNLTLAQAFGLNYIFEDFAVYMKARSVLFSDVGTPNQRMLARYFRFGSEGNGARVRISNALAPNASVSVSTDVTTNSTTDIRINLAGGALRTPTVRNGTKIGKACTSITNGVGTLVYVLNLPVASINRFGNVTTAILTLPAGITNHGLVMGNTLWLQSTDVNFSTGLVTITGVTATDRFSYADVNPNAAGGAVGTVSFDSVGENTLTGSGTVAGDFFRLNAASGSSLFFNSTFFTTNVTAGSVTMTSGEQTGYTPSATLAWSQVDSVSSLQIFANPAQTANQVISAVNALAAINNSKVPISLTALGAGSGTIINSTPEFIGDSSFWYLLSDGLNWVKTTIPAPNLASDYQLTFKAQTTGSLSTNSDWQNEVLYVVPITLDNLIEWLNTPTITGLWNVADIEASSDGTKLQIATKSPGSVNGIQVEGGGANLTTAAVVGSSLGSNFATIKGVDGINLTGDMWVNVQNTNTAPKSNIITSTEHLVSWNPNGLITVSDPLYAIEATLTTGRMVFEAQGDYVAISDFDQNAGFNFNTINPGDYVRISPAASPTSFTQTSTPNLGLFKIFRIASSIDDSGGTIWIKNDTVIEETSECKLQVLNGNASVLPGDILSVNSPLWGVENQGLWTIESVGTTTATSNDPYTVNTQMKVSVGTRTPQAMGAVGALGTSASFISVVEGTPGSFIMKIKNISPNQSDGSLLDLRWDIPVSNSDISSSVGSIISGINKLGFSPDFSAGADGYNYDVGLIGEANRVIYGDLNDSASYPGVAADDAVINIAGPLIKRIQVTLSIRVNSPATEVTVANRVKSAVAVVINKTRVGQPIAISDLVAAAKAVVGVTSVAVVSPTYNASQDLIQVLPNEKPFVLNLDQDVQVLIIGN